MTLKRRIQSFLPLGDYDNHPSAFFIDRDMFVVGSEKHYYVLLSAYLPPKRVIKHGLESLALFVLLFNLSSEWKTFPAIEVPGLKNIGLRKFHSNPTLQTRLAPVSEVAVGKNRILAVLYCLKVKELLVLFQMLDIPARMARL